MQAASTLIRGLASITRLSVCSPVAWCRDGIHGICFRAKRTLHLSTLMHSEVHHLVRLHLDKCNIAGISDSICQRLTVHASSCCSSDELNLPTPQWSVCCQV